MREDGSKSRRASRYRAARCVPSDGFIVATLNLSSAYLEPEERYIPQLSLPLCCVCVCVKGPLLVPQGLFFLVKTTFQSCHQAAASILLSTRASLSALIGSRPVLLVYKL